MVCLFLQGGRRMRTEDIVSKVFTRSFMGYDIEEVDRFLDEVIDAIEQYEAEKKEMLTAMEYLLKKLENGKRPPVAEMREAIDSGKSAKKRGSLPERTGNARVPAKRADRSAPGKQKGKQERPETKAARSITRGGGNGTPKPVRAPRVSRVAAQQQPPEPKNDQAANAPAVQKREDWLDELLDNLSERDRQGYMKTAQAPAAQPANATKEKPAAAVPKTSRPQSIPETTKTQPAANAQVGAQAPKPQSIPEATKAQPAAQTPQGFAANAQPATKTTEPQRAPEARPAIQTPAAQPAPDTGDKKQEPKPQGAEQAKFSTEDAIRSFEETLRSLGGQVRPEAKPQTDERQPAADGAEESPAHMPKHAAAPEDKKQ